MSRSTEAFDPAGLRGSMDRSSWRLPLSAKLLHRYQSICRRSADKWVFVVLVVQAAIKAESRNLSDLLKVSVGAAK